MRTILIYLIQVFIGSGLLYGYYHFFLRNKKFHQYNRFFLVAAVFISLAVPFLDFTIHLSNEEKANSYVIQTLTNLSENSFTEPIADTEVIPGNENQSSPIEYIYWAYLFIMLLVLLRILISVLKIFRLFRNNVAEKLDSIYFVQTDEPGTPFSFFRWMFWNREIDLNSTTGEQIFRHELYHIRQKHSLDILFIEILTALFWINPFFHLVKKELRAIHEFLADRYAAKEHSKWDYAELLLQQVLQTRHSIVYPFFHNQIKRRIAMITSSNQPRHQYLRKILALPLLAILAILFAFSYKTIRTDSPITKAKKTITIVVDAAHGGNDPGAKSPDGKYQEASLALSIAKKIEQLAASYNVRVVMTRETNSFPGDAENINDALKERLEIAKSAQPDAYISIHVNVTGNGKNFQQHASGIEAYVPAKKQDEKLKSLASSILRQLSGIYKTKTATLQRSERGIFVLDHNPYPALLLQCGFIDNASDLKFFTDEKNQETIAKGILDGIVAFANNSQPSPNAAPIISDTPKVKVNEKVNAQKTKPIQQEVYLPDLISIYDSKTKKTKKLVVKPVKGPGSQQTFINWNKYFEENLSSENIFSDGKTEATFTITVKFKLDENGKPANLTATSYPPSMTTTYLVHLVQNAPKVSISDESGESTYVQRFIMKPGEVEPENKTADKTITGYVPVIPDLDLADLKKMKPHDLLGLPLTTEILNFELTFELNYDIISISNSGNLFSDATYREFEKLDAGKLLSVQKIKVKEQDAVKRLPAKAFRIVNKKNSGKN